jgi:hypothetical protein
LDLVVHERNQRRNHNDGAFKNESRNLEGQRLASTGRHDCQSVQPVYRTLDHRRLAWSKLVISPDIAQKECNALVNFIPGVLHDVYRVSFAFNLWLWRCLKESDEFVFENVPGGLACWGEKLQCTFRNVRTIASPGKINEGTDISLCGSGRKPGGDLIKVTRGHRWLILLERDSRQDQTWSGTSGRGTEERFCTDSGVINATSLKSDFNSCNFDQKIRFRQTVQLAFDFPETLVQIRLRMVNQEPCQSYPAERIRKS